MRYIQEVDHINTRKTIKSNRVIVHFKKGITSSIYGLGGFWGSWVGRVVGFAFALEAAWCAGFKALGGFRVRVGRVFQNMCNALQRYKTQNLENPTHPKPTQDKKTTKN